jgi:hypothetical protein
MKCNKTQGKWCKNKHGASKIIDTFETYQRWSHIVWTFLAKVIVVQDQAVLPVRKVVEELASRGRRVLGKIFGSAGVEEY